MVLTTAALIAMGLMGAGGALKGGSQLIQGIRDKRKGDALEEKAGVRPEFQIPDSVDKQIALYQQMSQAGMPGEDLMKQDIQASSARNVTAAAQLSDSPVGALSALGAGQSRELGAMRDLQSRAAMYQAQMQGQYAQAVGNRANWESEQWRQNDLLPWEINMNRAAEYQTQGRGNIMGAMDSFGSTLGQMGGYMGTSAMYDKMYPNFGNPAATNTAANGITNGAAGVAGSIGSIGSAVGGVAGSMGNGAMYQNPPAPYNPYQEWGQTWRNTIK